MNKKFSPFKILTAVAFSGVLFFASHAFAMTPTLSITSQGSNSVLLSGYGDPSASVQLEYQSTYGYLQNSGTIANTNTTGYFSATLSTSAFQITGGQQVYVMINGQQSSAAVWPYTSSYGTTYGYNYGNTYGTNYYGSTYGSSTYPYSGSSYYGNYYGNQYQNSYGQQSQQITLSQNSVQLSQGQQQSVAIYGGNGNVYPYQYSNNSYYILTNSSPNTVSASVSGSSLILQGVGGGTSNVTVCQTNYMGGTPDCATVYVTVPVQYSYQNQYQYPYGYNYGNTYNYGNNCNSYQYPYNGYYGNSSCCPAHY